MIDWLEEILKLAETQAGAEEQEELLSLRFLRVGAVRPRVQEASAEAGDSAVSENGSVLSAVPDAGLVRRKLERFDAATGNDDGQNRAADPMQPGFTGMSEQSAAGTAYHLEEAIGLAGGRAEAAFASGAAAMEAHLTSGDGGAGSVLRSVRERGRVPWTEVLSDLARRAGWAEPGEGTALEPIRAEVGSGLRALYRRAGEAVRNPVAPAAQAGITVLQESPGVAAGLTAEELDRAVRRDSRRYDGGMSIY